MCEVWYVQCPRTSRRGLRYWWAGRLSGVEVRKCACRFLSSALYWGMPGMSYCNLHCFSYPHPPGAESSRGLNWVRCWLSLFLDPRFIVAGCAGCEPIILDVAVAGSLKPPLNVHRWLLNVWQFCIIPQKHSLKCIGHIKNIFMNAIYSGALP